MPTAHPTLSYPTLNKFNPSENYSPSHQTQFSIDFASSRSKMIVEKSR